MSFNFTDLRDKLNKEAVIDRQVTTKSIEDLCRVTDLCKNDIIRGLADIIEKQNILLNNTLAGQGYIMNEIYDTGDSTASGFSILNKFWNTQNKRKRRFIS